MEADIYIGDTQLTPAQSMTIRVALSQFAIDLDTNGLGEDDNGKAMYHAYKARLSEIYKLISSDIEGKVDE